MSIYSSPEQFWEIPKPKNRVHLVVVSALLAAIATLFAGNYSNRDNPSHADGQISNPNNMGKVTAVLQDGSTIEIEVYDERDPDLKPVNVRFKLTRAGTADVYSFHKAREPKDEGASEEAMTNLNCVENQYGTFVFISLNNTPLGEIPKMKFQADSPIARLVKAFLN